MNLDFYNPETNPYRGPHTSPDTLYSLDKHNFLVRDTIRGFIPTEYPHLNELVANWSPVIIYEADMYKPPHTNHMEDAIYLPHPDSFVSPEAYAHVLLHELSHWTQNHGTPRETYRAMRYENIYDVLLGQLESPVMREQEEMTAELCALLVGNELSIPEPEVGRDYLQFFYDSIRSLDSRLAQRAWEYASREGTRAAALLLSKR